MDPLDLLDIWVRKHAVNLELPENRKKLMLADLEETGIEYLGTDAIHRAIHSDGRRLLRDILFHATIYENMRLNSLNLRGEEVTYHNGVVTKIRRHDLKIDDAKVDEEDSEIGAYQIANHHIPLTPERERSLKQFADKLRDGQTYHELRLWRILGNSPQGFTFTNQQVLRGYIVDFYSPGARLAIEVDGGSHLDRQDKDSQRTSHLASFDIEIMRFYNYQIEANAHRVVFEILHRIKEKLGRPQQSFAEYKKQRRFKPKRNRSEMSLTDSISEYDFGSIAPDNLATQAYSSNYLASISDGDYYSDNGLVSEEEILKGFQRVSDDELLSEEELVQVQYVRDFNIIYNEHDS